MDNASGDQSIDRIKDYAEGKLQAESYFIDEPSTQRHKFIEFDLKQINDGVPIDGGDLSCTGQIILIKAEKNFGFAEGNNIGIRFALKHLDPDYVLLLNNDTFVDEKFLGNLVDIAETDDKIGLVGPKVCYYHKTEIINSAGVLMNWSSGVGINRGIGDTDKGQFNEIMDFDALIGVCLLIRASLFEKVGYLDKKFFLLLEETDFCIRTRKSNFRVIFQPKSKVYHKEGFSGSLNSSSLYFKSRNRLFLIKKHQPMGKIMIYGMHIFLRSILDSVIYFFKGELSSSKAVITGILHGLRN